MDARTEGQEWAENFKELMHSERALLQEAKDRHDRIGAFGEAVWRRPKRPLWAVRILGQGTARADAEQGQRAKTHGAFRIMGVLLRDFLSSYAVVKIP